MHEFSKFAVKQSLGRHYRESEDPTRDPFFRDAQRIIHSMPFRNLAKKTLLYNYSLAGDIPFRSPLTQTMEVMSLASSMAEEARLNDRLTTAIALGHFLGAPVFGRLGREVLNEHASKLGITDFPSSLLSLYLVSRGNQGYDHQGLNLTVEVRDGILNCVDSEINPHLVRSVDKDDRIVCRKYPDTLEGCLVKAVLEVARCSQALDDILLSESLSGESIERILKAPIFHRIPIARDILAAIPPYRNLPDFINSVRSLLIKELIRFGKLEQLHQARTPEEFRSCSLHDNELGELQRLLDEMYDGLPFAHLNKEKACAILSDAIEEAGWQDDPDPASRMIKLFQIARLADDALRQRAVRSSGKQTGIPAIVADIQRITKNEITTPGSFFEPMLNHLAELSNAWVLLCRKRIETDEYLPVMSWPVDGFDRIENQPLQNAWFSRGTESRKGVRILGNKDIPPQATHVIEALGNAPWFVSVAIRDYLVLFPWPGANVDFARQLGECLYDLIGIALDEFEDVENRSVRQAEAQVYGRMLDDLSNYLVPIEKVRSDFRFKVRGDVHDLMNKLEELKAVTNQGRQDCQTWNSEDALHFIDTIDQFFDRFWKQIQKIRRFWAKPILRTVDLLEILKHQLEESPVRQQVVSLRIDGSDGIANMQVLADEHRLNVIFDNLIQNSMRSVRMREIHAAGAEFAPSVRFRVSQDGLFWKIVIADNGVGMPAEVRDKLYRQPVTTRPGQAGGNGAILVARYLCDIGGSIRVLESAPDSGTLQEVLIPCMTSK